MMTSLLRAVCAATLLLGAMSSAIAEDGFKPQLEKIVVNGVVLYEAGAKDPAKTIEVDAATVTRIECTFANKGDQPGEDPFSVFLHLDNGKAVISGDYAPATPTTAWAKDRVIVDSRTIDLSSAKGTQSAVFIGLYRGSDRISLINPGLDDQQRLAAGKLTIK